MPTAAYVGVDVGYRRVSDRWLAAVVAVSGSRSMFRSVACVLRFLPCSPVFLMARRTYGLRRTKASHEQLRLGMSQQRQIEQWSRIRALTREGAVTVQRRGA